MSPVPWIRIRKSNDASVNERGDLVLYWMVAYRRATWNFSLQRAVEWAVDLDKPLVIMEALRCGHRLASDRLHRFVLEGMAGNAQQFRNYRVSYYPYVEPVQDAGKGLVAALADRACVVITDDFPAFFSSNGGIRIPKTRRAGGTGRFKRPPPYAGGRAGISDRSWISVWARACEDLTSSS